MTAQGKGGPKSKLPDLVERSDDQANVFATELGMPALGASHCWRVAAGQVPRSTWSSRHSVQQTAGQIAGNILTQMKGVAPQSLFDDG